MHMHMHMEVEMEMERSIPLRFPATLPTFRFLSVRLWGRGDLHRPPRSHPGDAPWKVGYGYVECSRAACENRHDGWRNDIRTIANGRGEPRTQDQRRECCGDGDGDGDLIPHPTAQPTTVYADSDSDSDSLYSTAARSISQSSTAVSPPGSRTLF